MTTNKGVLLEIVKLVHINGNGMLTNNIQKEINLADNEFFICLKILLENGYIEELNSSKFYRDYIALTKKGIKLAKYLC